MHDFTAQLEAIPLLTQLCRQLPEVCRVAPFYLVGGAVREVLLGRPVTDLDFTSPHDLTVCAQALARHCGGHWFWLDQERRQSRVLVGAMTCDFVSWRAATLGGDLALRDFTINALALDLDEPLVISSLIDPLGGSADLERRVLRSAGPGVLIDDPLRILKGLRHVAELDLKIEPGTLAAMQAAAGMLQQAAPERLRSEIWQMLMAPAARRGLEGLHACGAGQVLFGPTFPGSLPFAQAALERAQQLCSLLSAACPHTEKWLVEPVEQRLDRATLLSFSATMRAIEASLPLRLARTWRFGRWATARLAALDSVRTELWAELLRLPPRPRAVAQWALQYSPDPVDLLLGLGLQVDLPPVETAQQLMPRLSLLGELDDLRQLPHLVDGLWLADELGLKGEMIGTALTALKRAEIYSGVVSAADARSFLRREFGKKS